MSWGSHVRSLCWNLRVHRVLVHLQQVSYRWSVTFRFRKIISHSTWHRQYHCLASYCVIYYAFYLWISHEFLILKVETPPHTTSPSTWTFYEFSVWVRPPARKYRKTNWLQCAMWHEREGRILNKCLHLQ